MAEENKKEALKKIIGISSLSDEDKKFWEENLEIIPEELAQNIYDMLAEFPNELPWLTDIYKRKLKAFEIMKENKEEGQKLLSAIFAEEKEKLEKLLANK
jgi:hypothetical protein